MAYPDKINALVDIAGTSTLSAVGHAARHNDLNDAFDELAVVLTVPAANTLALAPGGTECMRINNAGLITGTGTSLGAWTSYTPTLAGTGWAIGNGTTDCSYMQIGKLVCLRVEVTFGSTSTYGAGAPTLTSPVAGKSGKTTVHNTGLYFDASATSQYPVSIQHLDGTFYLRTLAQPTAAVTSAVPFTWATSDIIRFHGVYEAA